MRTIIIVISVLILFQSLVMAEGYTYTSTERTKNSIRIIEIIIETEKRDSNYVVGDTTISLETSYRYEKTRVLNEFLADSLTKENLYYIGNRINWENKRDTSFYYEGDIIRDFLLCKRTEEGKSLTTVKFIGDSVIIREKEETITSFSYNILYSLIVIILASIIGLLNYYKRINYLIHIIAVVIIGVMMYFLIQSKLAMSFVAIILLGSILSAALAKDRSEDETVLIIPYAGSLILFVILFGGVLKGSFTWYSAFIPAILPIFHGLFEVAPFFKKSKL